MDCNAVVKVEVQNMMIFKQGTLFDALSFLSRLIVTPREELNTRNSCVTWLNFNGILYPLPRNDNSARVSRGNYPRMQLQINSELRLSQKSIQTKRRTNKKMLTWEFDMLKSLQHDCISVRRYPAQGASSTVKIKSELQIKVDLLRQASLVCRR